MPYHWLAPSPDESRLQLWPYRSLPRRGFVVFIGVTASLLALPLLAVFGSPVLWGLLPFLLAALAAIWFAITRSYRDAAITEDLRIRRDRVTLERRGPRGAVASWQANPHWVQVTLHPKGGPVPQYLTLRGNGREVELGAFLSEGERIALRDEVRARLAGLRGP